MTLPDERYRAVVHTRLFLYELCNPEKTPRVPKSVRETASWLLRHYPSEWDMEYAAKGAPHVFAKTMEDVHRMMVKYEQGKDDENKSSE
jgi:hypothetical protein